MITIEKAVPEDLDALEELYGAIHDAEQAGTLVTGWQRGIYPTRQTAEAGLGRGDLFVMKDGGCLVGAAVFNGIRTPEYDKVDWAVQAPADRITVMHTLTVHPRYAGRGYGTRFARFYEEYAARTGRPYLRIDTNARNTAARRFYRGLGYREAGVIPCTFNGIAGVELVLLEKNPKQDSRL